ncbi:regulatory LuxR family protein [Murinocardiopsis flavida]|uniref:Regulatory LuxR family protein n=1 Tax=Murinocardiopsis flavida TaxID=645275 RepID=A0A2P8DUP4_9ACTN|nr:LuxR family transcriptional regulator [Murinocardiopsis flavida]PSL00912.1 regulatory LuxR family protein [Murinocardiopsis flavida]
MEHAGLVGRGPEAAAIRRFLDGVRDGSGGALVVRGEPGVGKTALLDLAAGLAGPMTVLRAAGAEQESGLAFAGLHQLLRPVAGAVDGLPPVQRDAVRGALGLGGSGSDDRFLVSAAVLSLLADAAAGSGLLCLVDDFQWLDRASADALLFAARRLGADGAGLLIAVRDTPAARHTLRGVPEIHADGLGPAESAGLFAARAAAPPADPVAARVAAATGGNPLAIGEIARLLTAEQAAGRAPLPDPLPAGDAIGALFGDRIRDLPADTRTLLLAAALDGRGDSAVVLDAARRLGSGPEALAPAEAVGLLSVADGVLRFRHPLIRAAVAAQADPARRRHVHGVLADLLSGADEDRSARHRAAAAVAPDEATAGALAASAARARARGGYADAGEALGRAADLTPDPGERALRLVAAAEASWLGGRVGHAQSRLAEARETAAEPGLVAEAAQLGGRFELISGDAAEAQRVFLDAAVRLADAPADTGGGPRPGRASLLVSLLSDAGEAASQVGDLATFAAIGGYAAALPDEDEDTGGAGAGRVADPRFLRTVLVGVGEMHSGAAARGAGRLRTALARIRESGDPPGGTGTAPVGATELLWAAAAASLLGEFDSAARFAARAGRVARVSGMTGTLPAVLEYAATGERMNSGFALSAAISAEGLALARESGAANSAAAHLANLAVVAALRGREDECRAAADEALAIAIPHRVGLRVGAASYALGLLDLGAGRFARAHERLAALAEAGPGTGHPVIAWTAAGDRVEAAAAAGDPAAAREATGFLQRWSAGTAAPRSRALLLRCRAICADDPAAVPLFEEALALLAGESGAEYERARTALLLGERLRRARRTGAARTHLRSAAEAFGRIGARPWEQRARNELRAAGGSADPGGAAAADGAAALDALSPQELRIARLVADGASNRDVAARLFLSPRTVEYHLYKVYPKLGVASRTELSLLLARLGAAGA